MGVPLFRWLSAVSAMAHLRAISMQAIFHLPDMQELGAVSGGFLGLALYIS